MSEKESNKKELEKYKDTLRESLDAESGLSLNREKVEKVDKIGNLETEATRLASDLKMEIQRRNEDNKEQYMKGIKDEKMIIRYDDDAPTKSMEFA